ncbi:MAG: type I-E CRISPR-associated protein Cas5/CasD [Chloroflexi bacterium]|nr:type I-E CRISPR-associated protein Cas5/CasD [Chloroflexota bacterium]
MVNTLFLRLEGPLQSWGERARWSERDTAAEPTKSGVVGLLGCALGIADDQPLAELNRSLSMGCRCDRAGSHLRDYHTVVGGVLTAEGKTKVTQSTGKVETVVSLRYYLCDASFLVALRSSSDELLERLAHALQAPVWPLYLGRKSCVPALPVYAGLGAYASLDEALAAPPLVLRPGEAGAERRGVVESVWGQGSRRQDNLRSRALRLYDSRYTRDILVAPQSYEEVEDDIPLTPVFE